MNTLYPIFLKTGQLRILIVGGGTIALEKLNGILLHAGIGDLTVSSEQFDEELKKVLSANEKIRCLNIPFAELNLSDYDVVFSATGNRGKSEDIYTKVKLEGKLINTADMPDLCDFYLGSVVSKGNLKLGISTNGKSPVMARRIRELFEGILPEDLDDLLLNLNTIRNELKGSFEEKSKKLHEITSVFVNQQS